jgi:hypothetical protein
VFRLSDQRVLSWAYFSGSSTWCSMG